VRATTNANSRHLEHFGQLSHEPGVDSFPEDGKCTRILQGKGIVFEACLAGLGATIRAVVAQSMNALGHEPDVTHDGHASVDQSGHLGSQRFAAFQLHRFCPAFLQAAHRGTEEHIHGVMLRGKRQIGHDHGVGFGSGHSGTMMHDHVERNGHRGLEAEDCIADRIAHQKEVGAGLVGKVRGKGVVCR